MFAHREHLVWCAGQCFIHRSIDVGIDVAIDLWPSRAKGTSQGTTEEPLEPATMHNEPPNEPKQDRVILSAFPGIKYATAPIWFTCVPLKWPLPSPSGHTLSGRDSEWLGKSSSQLA